jgi:pimeloyl-ACP methyl ester carboxylesterase
VLLKRAPKDRTEYISYFARVFKLIGSPDYPAEDDHIRELAGATYDRCHYPAGTARQLAAIMASGSRTAALRRLDVPTVVIHGRRDPLVPVRGGIATAKAIPGAELIKLPGMGHDMPRELWPVFVDAIARNAERARSPSARSPQAAA